MKYFITLLACLLSFAVSCQDNDLIKLTSERNENIIKIYAENFGDEAYEVTLNINSTGFKHTRECPIVEPIRSGEKKHMTTLIAKKNEQASYSMSLKYTPTHNKPKNRSHVASEASNINLDKGVFVFEKEGCGRCESVIKFLETNKVKYTALNISKNAGDNSLMWKSLSEAGFEGRSVQTPVIVVDGKVHYNLSDYNKLLRSLVK